MKFQIKDIAVKVGGVSAGAIAAKFSNRFLGTMNPKIRAVGKIIIGAVVPEFMPKVKIAGHIGTGFMAIGAAELFEEIVPTAPVSGTEDIMSGALGGPITIDEDYEDSEKIAGNDDDVINGQDDTDDDISGNDEDDDM